MTKKKRPFILFFALAVFMFILLLNTALKSNRAQPPVFYANNPPINLNCAFCHSCTPSTDSSNFVLQMGADTSSLSEVISGVTTYTPGVIYYLRLTGTQPSANYGFELTAEDTTNTGTTVTNFAILNSANTTLLSLGYNFVAHHNASRNNQWTFTWTAPTAYQGVVTFYYVGNDGNGDNQQSGDQIYLMSKKIKVAGPGGISDIQDKLNGLSVFPAIFDQHIQISFNLKENARVQCSVIDLNGREVKSILDEGLSAGSFNRSFDLSGLSSGVYLVKIQVGDAFTVNKIVKD